MKKFLKTLFILLLAIVFIPIVNAEDLEYEWGQYIKNAGYVSGYIYHTFSRDYGYDLFTSNKLSRIDRIIKLSENGEILDTIQLEKWYDFAGYDEENSNYVLFSYGFDVDGDKVIFRVRICIYNSNLEKIDEYEDNFTTSNYEPFEPNYMNVTDTYYVFIENSTMRTLVIDKDFASWEIIEHNGLSTEELKDLWGEYSIFIDNTEIDSAHYKLYNRYDKNDKGYRILQYTEMSEDDNSKNGLELYNKDRLVYTKEYSNNFISVLSDNGFYVIEEIDIDDREACENTSKCESHNKITKYDFNGEKIYEKDLQKMYSSKYDYQKEIGRKITDAKVINNSLTMISNYEVMVLSLDDSITGKNPAIIKYSLVYNIETKTDGSGEIKVASNSKPGEEVTYEVTPKEGYVLGVVKVKDKDGNVVEYTSNKFTMPASDVTIEATFLPKNPETKDIAIIGIEIIFVLGFGFVISNYKKLKFLK